MRIGAAAGEKTQLEEEDCSKTSGSSTRTSSRTLPCGRLRLRHGALTAVDLAGEVVALSMDSWLR